MRIFIVCFTFFFTNCSNTIKVITAKKNHSITGSQFYADVLQMKWKERDSLALAYFEEYKVPSFLQYFAPIHTSYFDTVNNKMHKATFYTSVDYLSIGTNKNWARIPLTPITAQKIATLYNCFLPTVAMVDSIYSTANIKLQPMPLYIYRDSSNTMWQHHLIIEGQRKQQTGLIAGIKKDIVISNKILAASKQNKVAIYGWHLKNGKPIQPLYTGHVNWYTDYSHGVRLIYNKIKINGKWMYYEDVLKHSIYKNLLTKESGTMFTKYPISY